MTSRPDMTQQITDYLRSEGSRSLDELVALMGTVAADWQRCLEAMSDAQASFHPRVRPRPRREAVKAKNGLRRRSSATSCLAIAA